MGLPFMPARNLPVRVILNEVRDGTVGVMRYAMHNRRIILRRSIAKFLGPVLNWPRKRFTSNMCVISLAVVIQTPAASNTTGGYSAAPSRNRTMSVDSYVSDFSST